MKHDPLSSALGQLAREALEHHPDEAARLLERSPPAEAVPLLERLPVTACARIVERLAPEAGSRVLEALSGSRLGPLLAALDPPRAAALVARLDPPARERVLDQAGTDLRGELRALASYPPESAGAMMDPRVLAVGTEATVGQVLGTLRRFRNRRVRRVFLIDGEARPLGAVPLQEVAMARPSERLGDLSRTPMESVAATAGREEVVEVLERTRQASLPVVDFEGRIVGVLRDDVLLGAAQEEATAGIQTMVGASREERALSPVGFAVRKRLPWLEVNLATAFLAASVVGLFEGMIARFTALAVLLPVVAGQSGNTGAQALAVTMRGLALREIRVRQWLRVAFKEVRVAFFNGVAVALTTSLAVWIWSRSPGLALVIGVSMVISMVTAGLSGAAIPMLLVAGGQDPAQSSSIILTTVTDVVGFFSFLGIATLLASML